MGLLDALPMFARVNKLVRANILSPSGEMGELLAEIKNEPAKEDITSVRDANLITSERRPGYHIPVLDLDLEAKLIPSSTPGHWHLYIDKELKWDAYLKLLEALKETGIIQEGFYAGAKERGYSSVRLPHISKDNIDDNVINPAAFKEKQKKRKDKLRLAIVAEQLDTLGGTDHWTAENLGDLIAKLAAAPLPDNEYLPTLQTEYEKVDTKS